MNKKFLFLFLAAMLIIVPVSAESLEESAAWCKNHAADDNQFYEFLILEVQHHIKYQPNPGWSIMPPEMAWEKGYGDCSERSLVLVRMLESQGYKGEYVWGTWNKILHARVMIGKQYIDATDPRLRGDWVLQGKGLHPREYLVS